MDSLQPVEISIDTFNNILIRQELFLIRLETPSMSIMHTNYTNRLYFSMHNNNFTNVIASFTIYTQKINFKTPKNLLEF